MRKYRLVVLILIISAFLNNSFSQNNYKITGTVTEESSGKPLQNATLQMKGTKYSILTKRDGSFTFSLDEWHDSLQITIMGFATNIIGLEKGKTEKMIIAMKSKVDILNEVVVSIAKKPGKTFMEKVIEKKELNNPSRFKSYSYQRYTRNELDIDNIDFKKVEGSGIKSLMLKTYAGFDSSVKEDKELPVYFAERIANNYHSISPNIERENMIAKKSLGLKTDDLLTKLDRFYFNLNIYDNWIPLFDQTYISPLNSNAFYYYEYFKGSLEMDNGDSIQEIRFIPLHKYQKTLSGSMWINTRTFAIETVNMHLSQTANRNFINDIRYIEDYKKVYDNASDKWVNMPYKFSSEVKFESGLALLGIPAPENKSSLKFIIKNTTVTNNILLNAIDSILNKSDSISKKRITYLEKQESYWAKNRPVDLTTSEKNIYRMFDTLKLNKIFQRNIKLIAFAGLGYWDFGNQFRIGPYTSFVSHNPLEGWRFRLGFWTMPGISEKINIFGYAAYGTLDQKMKGMLGIKYLWNKAKWTKTTFSYASDYDFIIDKDDELDKDNILNSLLRKNVPFTRMYVDYAILKHEQFISSDFSAKASIGYKVINPVFDFKYKPINGEIDNINDSSIYQKILPVAAAAIGIRYAHKERTRILNYDKFNRGTFSPILTANFTYGFEVGKSSFEFQKINVGIEQNLQLPPNLMLYYKFEAGKTFGTLPYLLLNIPSGNEYYVSSKYSFNTMAPYEFATDRYISFHTRLNLGGSIFDKIPLLQKLGWRERFSFNAYWGDMNLLNTVYNKGSNFNQIGKTPFMETSIGVENIFHILSIEYYRRLNYLNNPYARKSGIFIGIVLSF